jgi:dsRNA-specific ribonuclease
MISKYSLLKRILQVCTQKGISLRPEYTFKEDKAEKTFICTSTLRDIVIQETGTSKKKAKTLAAKRMHDELVKLKEQEGLFWVVYTKINAFSTP